MKKILVILFAIALMAGCMSANSVYDGWKPSHTVANSDGSTTFEFLFAANDFNSDKASQRIDEYCTRYKSENGFTAYQVMSTNYADRDGQVDPSRKYTRVLVQVKFRT